MNAANEDSTARKSPRGFWVLGLLLVVLCGGLFGIHYWRLALQRISTDDAYLTADITQIAPQVSGTVTRVYVQDDEKVTAGQLLVIPGCGALTRRT